jgi:hypothetical protein
LWKKVTTKYPSNILRKHLETSGGGEISYFKLETTNSVSKAFPVSVVAKDIRDAPIDNRVTLGDNERQGFTKDGRKLIYSVGKNFSISKFKEDIRRNKSEILRFPRIPSHIIETVALIRMLGTAKPGSEVYSRSFKTDKNFSAAHFEKITNFLGVNGLTNTPTMRLVPEKEFHFTPHNPAIIGSVTSSALVDLQIFYDMALPSLSTNSLEFDTYHVHTRDLEWSLPHVRYEPYRLSYEPPRFDHMLPNLRTVMPTERPGTAVESLLAIIKRNLNSPELTTLKDDDSFSAAVVDKFFETYIDKNNKWLLEEFKINEILPNIKTVQEWLVTQKPEVIDQIEPDVAIWNDALDTYAFAIKRIPKPSMEPTSAFEYAALQTIVYHPKHLNAFFCVVFREMKHRLTSLMKSKFMLFCDMSPDEFAEKLNQRFKPSTLFNRRLRRRIELGKRIEIDARKYDKSQEMFHLRCECGIMRRLGVPEWIVTLWFIAHILTMVHDRKNKLRFMIFFQRKSGDASTFFGNTIILMCMVCTCMDLTYCVIAIFAGDDSLVIFIKGFNVKINTKLCTQLFNFELKVFNYTKSYFCSKFLIIVDDTWYFIPDPLKFITKLGRTDMMNEQHVKEYYMSCHDLMKNYSNPLLYDELSLAVAERYCLDFDSSFAFRAISTVCNDEEQFCSMFMRKKGGNYCEKVSYGLRDI